MNNDELREYRDNLKYALEKMNEQKPNVNLILRQKIEEYENEVSLCTDIIEEYLTGVAEPEQLDDKLIKHILRSNKLHAHIMQITSDLRPPSKN